MRYFNGLYGAGEIYQDAVAPVLALIADRYIADNPAHPFSFHSFRRDVFPCGKDGRFLLDLDRKFPDAQGGDRALVRTSFWQERDREEYFAVNCFGPVRIEMEEAVCFQSGVAEEANRDIRRVFSVYCRRGWHTVSIFLQKTMSGYGCVFGVNEPKWRWKPFFSTLPGEEGQLGFRYRSLGRGEEGVPGQWLPEPGWGEEEQRQFPGERIYGGCGEQYVYACTCLEGSGDKAVLLLEKGADTEVTLWLDGRQVERREADAGSRRERITVSVLPGEHMLTVQGRHETTESGWGWRLSVLEGGALKMPVPVHGTGEQWLYLGPFAEPCADFVCRPCFSRLYRDGESGRYYRLDAPETAVRPVLENLLFGRWNYPLGVTLCGLMAAARYLKDEHILNYLKGHMGECVKFYRYSLWDKAEYGYPEINAQLTDISMLDDCGSFAGAMLELELSEKGPDLDSEVKEIADMVAAYMRERQERREDGAFYRICKGHFMEDTLWADDLYMSVPFLCRYYRLSGEMRYIDDAANQFIQFRKYLYLPDENLMSHVYSFKYGTHTGMPWGRGNGWVLFSLSELLAVMPEGHENREELSAFFRQLADGCLARQLPDGMWPQLLNAPDSYEETSCTAMFVYGLSRGVRYGWLEGELGARAEKAARLGWKGLTRTAIDGQGNVYGVCEGSAWSFKPEYYTKELGWILNDPHGTGIVLLAGMEVQRMRDAEVRA